MNIYYVISAHKNPDQLAMLIDALQSETSRFFIHIDRNTERTVFEEKLANKQHVYRVKNTVKVRRGGFSIVQAILNAMYDIIEAWLTEKDYVVIMSGQCFPIKSPAYIWNYLHWLQWKSSMQFLIQPTDERDIRSRVKKYHFHDLVIPDIINSFFEKIVSLFIHIPPLRNQIFSYILTRIVNFFVPARNYLLSHYTLYRGSQWQILHAPLVFYCKQFCDSVAGKKFIQSFKNTAWPDELFFQTLLLNSPHKDSIENSVQRYMDRKTGKTLPKVFEINDFEKLRDSDRLYARKFDTEIDKDILLRIRHELI